MENKYTYIKRGLGYVEFDSPILQELNGNNLGSTFDDYLNNKWVLLTDEQLAWKDEHSNASIKEVFNMAMTPAPIRTLLDAQNEMIAKIEEYDRSDDVNGFDIKHNGELITTAWFEPEIRANYKNSVESAELLGLSEVSFYIGEMPFTLSTQNAKMMLAQIQLYADACYIVTKQHIVAVEALENIEDIDSYNYTAGYPNKLEFSV